jgi:hypothetical protein
MHDLKDHAFFNAQSNQNNMDHGNSWYTSISHSIVSHEITSENNRSTVTEAQLYNAITLAAIKSKLTPDQYLKFYGVEQSVFQRLIRESLEYTEKWIILDRKLTKEQCLRVWDACCATKWFQKEQKRKGRMNIEKEFDKQLKRQQKKKEAVQALPTKQVQKPEDVKKAQNQNEVDSKNPIDLKNKKTLEQKQDVISNFELNEIRFTTQNTILQQRLEKLGFNPEQYIYLPSDVEMLKQEYSFAEDVCDSIISFDESDSWSLRKVALEKTKNENFVQSWQEVEISDRAKAYLQLHDLKPEMYTRCYGTALQQEINRKNCEIIELVAEKQREILPKTTFLGYAMQCVDASWWANEFEAIILATDLQDLGKQCCHIGDWIITEASLYGKAIADGVVESAHDFLDMVIHPLDTINSFAKAAYFVTETLTLYNPELWLDYPNIFEPMKEQRQQLISSTISAGVDYVSTADGPQRLKMATKFVSDCIFQHKALQVVGAVAGVLRTQVEAIRTMELVSDFIGHESVVAGVGIKMTPIVEELEVTLEKNVIEKIRQYSKKVQAVNDIEAYSVNASEALDQKLRALQRAQKEAKTIRKLSDGRIRYYEAEKLSKTPGPTRGAALVTEHNNKTGQVRIWYECYDHAGNVNRVHPKMID